MGHQDTAIAIVGLGAVLPDAPNVDAFRRNLAEGRYSISETPIDRWDPALYYDPDMSVPDKTYSKIGGWVRDLDWNPLAWRLPIPPKVAEALDLTHKYAIIATRELLADYGYPERPLDPERTAVILGNAMGGDTHLMSAVRILFPEIRERLVEAATFRELPADVRAAVLEELQAGIDGHIRGIDEDTMPGELANITAGRIAALYDFKGPNYVTDAACASAMAGIQGAISGLMHGDYDAVITGGVDANMSPSTYVKFSKIGALSATGTRPYAEGADGFVMGEGAGLFLMKRLADADRDGDTVYAVVRGVGGSSDGKGKGITAPNPVGQKLAVRRGWENAGLTPQPGDMVEGHGTSTKVGDAAELESLDAVFGAMGLPVGSIALGSVKSNFGHLKGAAGAAGLLKATVALHDKTLAPNVNFHAPNPNFDFASSPFQVNVEHRPWEKDATDPDGQVVRRAGISAFGFGGTNFHMVLEEHIPGRVTSGSRVTVTGAELEPAGAALETDRVGAGVLAGGGAAGGGLEARAPLQGALVIGGASEAEIAGRLREVADRARAGQAPEPAPPAEADLRAPIRLAIDYADAGELASAADKALAALESGDEGRWRALSNRGIFLGRGAPGKVAFLFTGQGAQYVNMLRELRDSDPAVAETFAEADAIMEPLNGEPLTDRIFVDADDDAAVAEAEEALKQTAVTQPAVLTVDTALARLIGEYGIEPDMTMGHSLGEYGALVAAGAMPFKTALTAVSARGKAMTEIALDDNGCMAAVFGPMDEVEKVLVTVDGYVVVANLNSMKECVIGGATVAVEAAVEALKAEGLRAQLLPVSHAFHTDIVAPAAEPLKEVLRGLDLHTPRLPIVANITGEFYPSDGDTETMVDILGRQVGSPVQFVKGLETLYEAGARVFVEVGPKRVLYALVRDVLGDHDDVTNVYTNHPRNGDVVSANRALCALYAAGLGTGAAVKATEVRAEAPARAAVRAPSPGPATPAGPTPPAGAPSPATPSPTSSSPAPAASEDRYLQLGRMFADFMDRSVELWSGEAGPSRPTRTLRTGITGASLGLPGTEKVFGDDQVARLLRGEMGIKKVSDALQEAIAGRRITRLVKGAGGEARFETIDDPADVIKLAGRGGELDLAEEYGFPADRIPALDRVTRLAIAAGIDALRDAGIPLVMRYKTTTTGSKLPDGWGLPASMQDDTGVIFASAFPGLESFAEIIEEYHEDLARRQRLEELESVRQELDGADGALDARIEALRQEVDEKEYRFDRRFLFRVLNMGHSQFAEYIGARGPNVGTNGACASGTQAMGLARDWIEAGRCRRVIIVSADDVSTDRLFPWFGAGFLASGAAATDARVEDAALPFDRRRHGLIVGMGGAAMVVEDLDAAAERGLQPIIEIKGTVIANSAFHGSRLDVNHIVGVMERLVSEAESRHGLDRREIAGQLVFVSHETYTPARGGSASAEVNALKAVFGTDADRILVANTKGFTGHPMAVGVEDTLAVKILETGIVPPVANYKEVDPDLGFLNLSKGGPAPVRYALRLGAGFGSQIAMSLMEWMPPPDGARRDPHDLGFRHRIVDPAKWRAWLAQVTGQGQPELEIVRRTLRVKDGFGSTEEGVPVEVPEVAATPVASTARAAAAIPTPAPVAAPATAAAAQATPPPADSPAPAAAPAPAPAPAADPIQERVLAIVAEQTGYPPDMLALDLDLEADLGIDTVKQAEMFAAIRAEYDIERDDNLALRDYPTLARAIEFVYEKRPDLEKPTSGGVPAVEAAQAAAAPAASAAAPVPSPAAAAAAPAVDPVQERVLAIVAEQTGYPPDMLELDLDLEADLGIDTVKQAEMFAAIRAEYDIERDDELALRDYPTLARAIEFVYEKRPDLEKPTETVVAAAAPGPSEAMSTAPAASPVGASTPSAPQAQPGPGSDVADPVQEKVLAIVAEQTGYPPDMLELDLDLEADLGIDTVKQAEMFAAIRAEYDIERDDELALRDYPTLARAIEFVYEKRPDLEKPAAGGISPEAVPPSASVPAQEVVAGPSGNGGPTGISSSVDPVQKNVLAIVAEQTGYPPDMLELDLDLEADLGIDTVKQAEMFAAIRAEYDIERDDELALRDYPTLARAIEFVYEKRPDLAGSATGASSGGPASGTGASAAAGEGAAQAAASAAAGVVRGDMVAAQGVPRRVPVPWLRPDVERFRPTGVVLEEGDRVVVMPDEGGVARALVKRLEKRGVEALVVEGSPDGDALEAWLTERSGEPIKGVYWLPALDQVEEADLLDPDARKAVMDRRVKGLYRTLRTLYDQVGGLGTFLVSATRLGGKHGYDDEGAADIPGGAVTGLTKSFARERPDALVKAVDFAPSRKTAALAERLLDETEGDPGAVEVGYADDRRWTIGLSEIPVEAGDPAELASGTFVITGAAGSITSAIVADLAGAAGAGGEGGATFWLLDLTPVPDADDPELDRLDGDRDGLKRDIFARLKETAERATPAMVEKELARLERSKSALDAIRAVEAAGATAHYRSLDLRDADAVAGVMAEVAEGGDPVTIVHAGGLEISRSLPDKAPEEFDLVFDVKTEGWFNVLAGLGETPVDAAVVFSSIAGRFGNAGQADYSAANDLLCKAMSSFRSTRPEARGIAIDWTAWGGIGMATRGSIPTIMKEAGIDMLPPEAGIPVVRRELTAGTRGEVLIGGALGVMMEDAPEGGLDVEVLAEGRDGESTGPMIGAIRKLGVHDGLVVETTLDPSEQPFLHDHQIDGTPVLPGVMGIEAMAEAARLPFPELQVVALEDVDFLAPFKFYRNEPRTVTVRARFTAEGDGVVAECELLGSRVLHGRDEPEITTHFTARVRLAESGPEGPGERDVPEATDDAVEADAIYETYFHGPAYQVLDGAWRAGDEVVGRFAGDLPDNHRPQGPTLVAPRLVELAFQTAGVLEIAEAERMGLPAHIDRLELFQPREGPGAALAGAAGDGYDVEVTDEGGSVVLAIRGYRTSPLPTPVTAGAFAALTG